QQLNFLQALRAAWMRPTSRSREPGCLCTERWTRAANTLEFRLSPTREAEAAKAFFHQTLSASHTVPPRVITVDKNAAYPKALADLKSAGAVPQACELRQRKYLNPLVEQDHQFIKRLVKRGVGFWSFATALRTLQGYEVMNRMRNGQVQGVDK